MTSGSFLFAQQSAGEQLWTEYMLNYAFANVYNLENAFTASTNFYQPKWRALDYAPTLERAFSPHIDATVGFTFSYTLQNETSNTFEVRPTLGTRIHFTPNRRILFRTLFRFEQRNFLDLETKDWDHTERFRVRPELLIPINRNSYFRDNMMYAIIDAEWFFVLDRDVEERFANRFRFRTGLGYRLSKTWRFEVIYMSQSARNTIDSDFALTDNIFRVRVKHYINRKVKADAP